MKHTRRPFDFSDMIFGPSQVWGAVRLIPLLREQPIEGLRLSNRIYHNDVTVVGQGKRNYISYIPNGIILDWNNGSPIGAYGTQIEQQAKKAQARDHNHLQIEDIKIGLQNKVLKREHSRRMRLLPLHLTLDGLLGQLSKQPSVAWSDYRPQAVGGCAPYVRTQSISSWGISGLRGALERFEIHPMQTGVLLFIEDAFVNAFVVSHHDDYRPLHQTIIRDVFCDIFWHYGQYYTKVPAFSCQLDHEKISSLTELKNQYLHQENLWRSFRADMAGELLSKTLFVDEIYKKHGFSIERFFAAPSAETDDFHTALSQLSHKEANHIGECIRHKSGRIAYLKTYRLNNSQSQRLRVLSQLQRYNWNIHEAAEDWNITHYQFRSRMVQVGLRYMLK